MHDEEAEMAKLKSDESVAEFDVLREESEPSVPASDLHPKGRASQPANE